MNGGCRMSKTIRLGHAIVSGICLILFITVIVAPMYPVGYWEQGKLWDIKEGYAGHGYYSLAQVAEEGFFWEADEVPVEWEKSQAEAPYYAVGHWWVALFYVPIFLGILYLALIIGKRMGLDWSINHPSRKSGKSPE